MSATLVDALTNSRWCKGEIRMTIVFVTHDVGEAVELSNRILVFAKGGRLEDDITVDLP